MPRMNFELLKLNSTNRQSKSLFFTLETKNKKRTPTPMGIGVCFF